MRILVTGGAGFIGSHFVDRLLSEGHELLVVDNLSSGRAENLSPAARLAPFDLGSPQARQVIEAFRPEAVFHFAAQINVQTSIEDPVLDAEQNVLNTLRLLEQIKGFSPYFAFASSGGAIYGEADHGAQDENHPEYPLNPYGVAKLAIDRYLHAFHHQYGLRSCSMRFSNVYGPRQNGKGEAGVVSIFMERLHQGEKLTIFGDGSQERDFVFAKDLAAAAPILLAQRPVGVFNLSTGKATSILQLAESCQRLFERNHQIEFAPARPGEQRRSLLSPDRAQRILGWTAQTSLDSGLSQTKDCCLEASGVR